MNGLFSLVIIALSAGVLSGCPSPKSRLGNHVVVQVNDKKLSAKEFADLLARQLKNFDALSAKNPDVVNRTKDEIIRNFILQALTAKYADQSGITISESELDQEVKRLRSSYPDDLSFRKILAEEGVSLSEWKDQLKRSLIDQKVFVVIGSKIKPPTLEEKKKYFDETKDRYKKKERIFLRQIVVDDFTKAVSLRDELKKADFAASAKKFSVSPEAKDGGAVGWIERGSVDVFDKAFSLPIGGISQVLESSYGFHIFKVDRKAPAGSVTFEEVQAQIERALNSKREQAEFLGWLDGQIRKSQVLKDLALIESIHVETRGVK